MSHITEALESILESSPGFGSFCATRTTSTKNLAIQVKDFGPLEFPLSARKAKALIKCAKPANFGWRNQTLHDKGVRDVWEIHKNKIKIDKRLWNKTLNPLLDQLKNDLGLPEHSTLKAELHNLLIYTPGQFFSPHQDAEKIEGMLATLLVVLPSAHSGGSLVIDHQGTKKQFQSSRYALDKLVFCAFYADCHHEVKPVKSGHRVVLSYNLVLSNSTDRSSIPMNTAGLKSALSDYFSDSCNADDQPSYRKKAAKKMVYLLDHSYTQKGLSWQHLKNVDRLRADALKESAEALDLDIHLALADMQETWQCEDDYDPYYRHRGSYDDDDDDDCDYDSESEAEPIELIEQVITLRHWLDRHAKRLDYRDLYIPDNQLHWTRDSDDFEPFETEYEGWMGNYGSTLDRWYHRAAIILWRKQDHFPVLLEMDPDKVITHLLILGRKKSNLSTLHDIVRTILPYWPDYLPRETTLAFQEKILKLALCLERAEQAKKILQAFNLKILQVKTIPIILSLSDCYGIDWCISLFKAWSTKKDGYAFDSQLCENIDGLLKALIIKGRSHIALCDWLIKYQFTTIKKSAKQRNDRVKKVIALLRGCDTIGDIQTYASMVDVVIENSKLYPAFDIIPIVDSFISAKTDMHPLQLKAQKLLCTYVNDTLQAEFDLGLRAPTNWRIQKNTGCRCEDCVTFTQYLRAKTEVSRVWPMGKERRAHIHRTIDQLGLPISHTTLRQGSPHKLVLKKTKALYSRAKERYTLIGNALGRLQQHELV